MERAGRLIAKLKLSPELADPEARARAAWKVAAGKKIAGHTLAAALVRDTLIVEVEDIVWQRQLASLEHFLLRNLAEALGEPLVKKIDFRSMPPRRRPQRAETARPSSEKINDPVLDLVYRQLKFHA
jgi:predicted nucleic acid-binding Zn ribbon protein